MASSLEWGTAQFLIDDRREVVTPQGEDLRVISLRKANENEVNQTLRLDPDVLEAYRSKGAGWQSIINDVLREHMSDER